MYGVGSGVQAGGGLNTMMSPRLYESQRGVSLSTSTYCPGSRVRSIEFCCTWYGWAMKFWMTKKMISVRIERLGDLDETPKAGASVHERGV